MKANVRIAALGAALTLSGCGQKGPLVLPDKNAQVITSPAPAAPSPATPAQTPRKSDDPSEDTQTPKQRP